MKRTEFSSEMANIFSYCNFLFVLHLKYFLYKDNDKPTPSVSCVICNENLRTKYYFFFNVEYFTQGCLLLIYSFRKFIKDSQSPL